MEMTINEWKKNTQKNGGRIVETEIRNLEK